MATLQAIRDHFGKPVKINSAYRSYSYNKKVGGSSNSQHRYGTAADICITGVDPLKIAMYAASLPYFQNHGGIGLYSRASGVTAGFVHVDTRASVSRWISRSGTAYLSASKIMPTIKVGASDGQNRVAYAVTVLQRHLGVTADGVFGNGTKKALIAWQMAHGLEADGIAGPATWGAM